MVLGTGEALQMQPAAVSMAAHRTPSFCGRRQSTTSLTWKGGARAGHCSDAPVRVAWGTAAGHGRQPSGRSDGGHGVALEVRTDPDARRGRAKLTRGKLVLSFSSFSCCLGRGLAPIETLPQAHIVQ